MKRSLTTFGTVVVVGIVTTAFLSPRRPDYLPDPAITPGAVMAGVTSADTCDPGYAKRVRHVTAGMKREILRRYRIPAAQRDKVEIDHLVPLCIAGSNELGNLWAQPWDGPYGAHAKDKLENRSRMLVCSGKMTIEEAQRRFRTDWVAFHREQFGPPATRKTSAAQGEVGDPPDDDDPPGDAEGFPRG